MADDDILFKAAIDLSDIDPQIDALKRKFEELSKTSLSFGNFNRSIRAMTDNITAAAVAFERFNTAAASAIGNIGSSAASSANAIAATAKEAKTAASAVSDLATAEARLAQAERTRGRTPRAAQPGDLGVLVDNSGRATKAPDYSGDLSQVRRMQKLREFNHRQDEIALAQQERARRSIERNTPSNDTSSFGASSDWRKELRQFESSGVGQSFDSLASPQSADLRRKVQRQLELNKSRQIGVDDGLSSTGLNPRSEQYFKRQSQLERTFKSVPTEASMAKPLADASVAYFRDLGKQQEQITAQMDAMFKQHAAITPEHFSNRDWRDEADSDMQSYDANESREGQRRQADLRRRRDSMNNARGVGAFAKSTGTPYEAAQNLASNIESGGLTLRAFPNVIDNIASGTGRVLKLWAEWSLVTGAVEVSVQTIAASIREAGEYQTQSVLFQSAQRVQSNAEGKPTNNATPNGELLSDSIALASAYGERVNDVAQDINLWKKSLGDLNASLFMTNEALKFQVATGTQTEDLYKTLTGLSAQANHIPLNIGDKRGFALDQTPQLLNEIYAAATYAGAGMHQLSDSGVEMHNHINNAAVTLLEALDKDTAALGQMGYSMTDIIAINQGLITAFGNDGAAASEAADKIGRISGGLAGFGKPNSSVLKAFSQQGIDLSGVLNTSVDKNGSGVLDRLASQFGKLDTAQKNSLATSIAGNRQYEALFAILDGLSNKEQILQAIKKNGTALDDTVIQMQGTYGQSVNRMSAAWDGFLIVVGTGVLPMLTSLVQYVATTAIPTMLAFAGTLGGIDWSHVGTAAGLGAAAGGLAAGPAGIIPGALLGGGSNVLAQVVGGTDANKLRMQLANSGALNEQGLTKNQWTISQGPRLKQHPWVEQYPSMLAMQRPQDPLAIAQNMAWHGGDIVNIGKTDATIKALMQKAQEAEKGGSLIGPQKGGGAGTLKDYQAYGDEIKSYMDTYKALDAQQKDSISTDQAGIESIKKHISEYGSSEASLKSLTAAYSVYDSAIQKSIGTLQQEEAGLQQRAAGAKKHVRFDKSGRPILATTEDAGWFDKYSSAVSDKATVHGQIVSLQGTLSGNSDDLLGQRHTLNRQTSDAANAVADAAYKNLSDQFSQTKSFSQASGLRDKLTGAANDEFYSKLKQNSGIYEGQDLIKADAQAAQELDSRLSEVQKRMVEINTQAKEFSEQLSRSTQDASYGLMSAMAKASNNGRGDPHQENLIRLIQGRDNNKYQADKDTASHPDDAVAITNLKNLKDAQDQATYSLQEYEDHLNHLESSPLFQGLTDAFKTLGDIVDKDLTDIVSGTDAATRAIANLKSQLQQVQNGQTTDNFYYQGMTTHSGMDAANQALSQYNSQSSETAIQAQISAQQYKLQNPSILNQVFTSFFKTSLGSATSSLAQSGLGSIANSILGVGSTGSQDTQLGATQANTTALAANTTALGKVSNGINGASASSRGGISGLLTSIPGLSTVLSGVAAGTAAGGLSGGLGSLISEGGAAALLGSGAISLGGVTGGGLAGGLGILGANPLVGIGIGLLGGLAGKLFQGPQYNAQTNPDMFASSGYAPAMANLGGSMWTQSTGNVTEDPTMQQALGGMNQLQYLNQFVASHPGGQGLTGSGLALYQQVNQATAGGTTTGVGWEHQGDIGLVNAAGQTVQQGNWQDLSSNLNNLTQATYAFNTALNQSTSQMMTVINQFGGSSGFYPYAGSTPGFGAPNNPANPSQSMLNPNGLPSNAPGAVTGVMGAATNPITAPGVRANGGGVIATSINIDGRQVARSVQSYTAQSNNAGFKFVS